MSDEKKLSEDLPQEERAVAGRAGMAEGEDVGTPGVPAPEGDLREEDVTLADGLNDRED